jgi:hypothetical protein
MLGRGNGLAWKAGGSKIAAIPVPGADDETIGLAEITHESYESALSCDSAVGSAL